MLNETNQTKRQIFCIITNMWTLKKKKKRRNEMNEYNKTDTDLQIKKINQWLPVKKGREEGQMGYGIKRHRLPM